ncbi:type II and III secretion system protein family protein [Pseudovibrio exalbescens]|uniref:type II and III secretion system protein family protein n=1 Tax=Pseudovibrio exalbescens TaxID=197461 RepID=UPI0023670C2C|nr:type II and III secretion system protein family protein [Pseudovibrio exalbescens]MDD7910089.1 type II and III secretion system protein family protein [Pseudovibrio exalbescens]
MNHLIKKFPAIDRVRVAAAKFGLVLICAMLVLTGTQGGASFAQTAFPAEVNIDVAAAHQTQRLAVGLGRSVILNSSEEVRDVLVSNPGIADAVVRTNKKIYVFGNEVGQATLVLFGSGGRQIASFKIRVEQDASDLASLIDRLLPNSDIEVEMLNGTVVLSGLAVSAQDAQMAADIASKFVSDDDKLVSAINVAERDQVQLKVTVAEVERSVVKQLGVNLTASVSSGNFGAGFNSQPGFNVNPSVVNQSTTIGSFISGDASVTAQVRALQKDGVAKTLAEPTLVAVSGENASFLAGGEFPIPVAYDDNEVSLEFKPYGVGLDFTPVVLSEGRIRLRVKTEVSELSNEGAVSITGGIAVSALKVRRAESTVELPSGGTLVMAGLLKEDYAQEIDGVPGLRALPILGTLFKSRDFRNQQTELVVFVTPYVVRPVASAQLSRPTDNLVQPDDSSTIFLNQLNRIYNNREVPLKGSYHGDIGYIYE